ncbi:Rid family detoxifying hydrolase [Blattabacterium cuenoti]|uniref:Rid family detoxifying hydrolase n=1 Tax=Blattabacterium cuenoti TaxID=1653831 RepID=UPI00163C7893|nr:Rid family detoxifying hydrolase [Blattabacterium cuenoti]
MKPEKVTIKEIPFYGPYSTYVFINHFVFISGQIGIDLKTGQLIYESISKETKQVMENLKFILSKRKLDFKSVIKSSIFIKNMNDFSKINEIYSSFFEKNQYPARETIQVCGLPKNANIEISMIAYENIP